MTESQYEKAMRELLARKEDIRPSDIVLFEEPLRSSLNTVIRRGRFSLTEFAEYVGFTREQTKAIADLLVQRNLFTVSQLTNTEETFYEARLTAMTRPLKKPPSDLWSKIG